MLLNRPDFNDHDFHYAIRNKISDAQKRIRRLEERCDQSEVLTTLSESSSSSSSDGESSSKRAKLSHMTISSQSNSANYHFDRSNNHLFAQHEYMNSSKTKGFQMCHNSQLQQPSSSSSSQYQPQAFTHPYSQDTNVFSWLDSFKNQQ